MTNPFANNSVPLNGPAADLIPVFPSDSADIPSGPAMGLYVETAGTIVFKTATGDIRSVNIPAGPFTLKVGVVRVLKTGTTAGMNIHAFVFPSPARKGGANTATPPVGLGWDSRWPLSVRRTDTGHDVGLDPRTLVDPLIWTGAAIHVDLAVGEDTYTGLGAQDGDFTNALRTIKQGFIEGDATGAPYRILVKAGECSNSAFTGNGSTNPVQPCAIIGFDGPVFYRTGSWGLTWALDTGTTYTSAVNMGNRVFRTDVLDGFGNYTELAEASDLTECRATVGTWFDNAGTLHVNIGSQPGTRDICALRNFRGAHFDTHAADLYLENIHCEGGINGALYCSATATRNLVAVDCSFKYSSPASITAQLDSVNISNTTGLCAFFNVNASYGAKDGFNFHEDNPGEMSALLVDCISHFNGKWGATSVNGVTTHEGVRAAIIGGDFGYSRGGAIAHFIGTSKTWAYDAKVVSRDPANDAIGFKCSESAVLYLEDTEADVAGSASNLAVEANGGTIFRRAHQSTNGSESAYNGGSLQQF